MSDDHQRDMRILSQSLHRTAAEIGWRDFDNWLEYINQHLTVPLAERVRTATCRECGRVFDLLDDNDAEEWHYGHDCES